MEIYLQIHLLPNTWANLDFGGHYPPPSWSTPTSPNAIYLSQLWGKLVLPLAMKYKIATGKRPFIFPSQDVRASFK